MTENELNKMNGIVNMNMTLESREEGQLRRSERKKVPSLWYIEHLNEYKKTASKKNSGFDPAEKSQSSSELSSPIQTQYLPFINIPPFYEPQSHEYRGYVAFVLRPQSKRSKELNRSKNIGKATFQKIGISKKKPQRKFHQTYSSSNRQRNHKLEKKQMGNMPLPNNHKKPENNNNILDMILSAAMKVKKDPSTTETHHKIPMKVFAECEDEKRMRGVHKHEMKEKTSDSSCIKKSIKKNGKIYMEHTNRGNIEIDYVEKKDPSLVLNYQKLFQSKLFENCFSYDKETLNNLKNDEKKMEEVAKEKLQELKESFQAMKKSSLIYI